MQGLPLPLVELRARDDDGRDVPRDGKTMGELEVRGPWVAAATTTRPTGRPLDERRLVPHRRHRHDRSARLHPDHRPHEGLIKSGGEWISSVELENALMAHPAVAEAAVIAVPDPKWDERPLAVVVLRDGGRRRRTSCASSSRPSFAKCWLPDRFVFVDGIPKTPSASSKTELREQFALGATGRTIVIKTVWLDNPPVNAVNVGDHRRRSGRRRSSSLDDEIRVVVLRGKGDRAFSAGADIARLRRTA